jgi:NodT family efflux transporter outer membrane factor (OMF) lipoprotein
MPKIPLLQSAIRCLTSILAVILFSSCSAFYKDDVKLPEISQMEPSLTLSVAPEIDPAWWKQLGDDQLNSLISRALKDSPTLKTADSRIQNAQALLKNSQSGLLPQVNLNTQLNRQGLSQNYIFPPYLQPVQNFGQITLNFDWALDIWGKQRSLLDGSKYRLVGARAQYDAAREGLSAGIVAAYIDFDYAYKAFQIANTDVQASKTILQIASERYSKGIIDQPMLEQAKVDVNSFMNQQVIAQKTLELSRHQIAALVGQGPSFGDQLTEPHLNAELITQYGISKIPSDLVARRPDLQGLLAQIQASDKELTAAHLDYLPSFDLAANAGYQAFGLNNLLSAPSQIFTIGPVINLPIFNGGRIDANVIAKKAIKDQAIADYHEQLLSALRESADGISSMKASSHSLELLKQSDLSAKNVLDIYKKRFQAGLMSTEQIQRSQIEFDRVQGIYLTAQKNVLSSYVQLIHALGGGYIAADAHVQTSSQQ